MRHNGSLEAFKKLGTKTPYGKIDEQIKSYCVSKVKNETQCDEKTGKNKVIAFQNDGNRSLMIVLSKN